MIVSNSELPDAKKTIKTGIRTLSKSQILRREIISVIVLITLVSIHQIWFMWIFKVNYLLLYVRYGTVISAALAAIALKWQNSTMKTSLISLSPLEYLAGYSFFMSDVSMMLGDLNISSPSSNRSELWDYWITVIWSFIFLALMIVWMIVIAPINYFLTTITGAPARRRLRLSEGKISPSDQNNTDQQGLLSQDALTITQFLNAIILFSIGWLI